MPQPKVIAARVANLVDKDFRLRRDPKKFFTEPHYPAILIRLSEITVGELQPIIVEAWRCQDFRDAGGKRTTGRVFAPVVN